MRLKLGTRRWLEASTLLTAFGGWPNSPRKGELKMKSTKQKFVAVSLFFVLMELALLFGYVRANVETTFSAAELLIFTFVFVLINSISMTAAYYLLCKQEETAKEIENGYRNFIVKSVFKEVNRIITDPEFMHHLKEALRNPKNATLVGRYYSWHNILVARLEDLYAIGATLNLDVARITITDAIHTEAVRRVKEPEGQPELIDQVKNLEEQLLQTLPNHN